MLLNYIFRNSSLKNLNEELKVLADEYRRLLEQSLRIRIRFLILYELCWKEKLDEKQYKKILAILTKEFSVFYPPDEGEVELILNEEWEKIRKRELERGFGH